MNLEHITKNIGCRVQLLPVAYQLDQYRRALPNIDDDWIIERVTSYGVDISNTRALYVTTLGKDHIHHFTSNPDRSKGGMTFGFFTLNVQLFLQGINVFIKPNAKPGEAVKPQTVEVLEKWVDMSYPTDSGIQHRLESEGYRVAWSLETHLARRIDLEGWEIVLEPNAEGVLCKFKVKDKPADQTLIKHQR